MNLVNYNEIKARVKMVHVLEHYGVLEDLREKGDDLVGCCPIHHGTNTNQFHVSRTKNNFMCFGNCHEGGNVIDFVVKMEGGTRKTGTMCGPPLSRYRTGSGSPSNVPTGGGDGQPSQYERVARHQSA
jgi:hypothetical protein